MGKKKINKGDVLGEYICIKDDNYNIHTFEDVFHLHEIAKDQTKSWHTELFVKPNGEQIYYELFDNIKGTFDEIEEILNKEWE